MVLGSSGFNSGASCFFFNIIAKKVLSPRPREGTVCSRPYRSERTGSLSNSEVNRCRARSVLGWGTAWEALWVLRAFSFPSVYNTLYFKQRLPVISTVAILAQGTMSG